MRESRGASRKKFILKACLFLYVTSGFIVANPVLFCPPCVAIIILCEAPFLPSILFPFLFSEMVQSGKERGEEMQQKRKQ